jgi:thiol-disulfide isomerase/thioredoxin
MSPVMPNRENDAPSFRRRRLSLVVTAAVAGSLAGFAGVYGIAWFKRNPGDAECQATVELARRLAPLARGEVAALVPAQGPLLIPNLVFRDGAGVERRLAEWRGRTVLINLWATWCVPCRKEMPALNALEAKLGSPGFEVVAINIDTRDVDRPHAWLKEVGVNRLEYYADGSAKVFQDLKLIGHALGLPTNLLVDPGGCEIGTMAGPAEWDSDDALRLVRAALGE